MNNQTIILISSLAIAMLFLVIVGSLLFYNWDKVKKLMFKAKVPFFEAEANIETHSREPKAEQPLIQSTESPASSVETIKQDGINNTVDINTPSTNAEVKDIGQKGIDNKIRINIGNK